MIVLGIHGSFGRAEHDPAAVLVRNGQIVVAAEEERFVRSKHAVGLMPENAIRFCLGFAEVSMGDVDCIAFPRATWDDFPPRLDHFLWYRFGHVPPVEFVDHHLAHAASAYLPSGFDSALVVTADQSGDGTACAVFRAEASTLTPIATVPFPDSLGLYASLMTQYLGFDSNHDEYKVMGLASHGSPRFDMTTVLGTSASVPQIDRRVLHQEALRRHPLFHTDQLPMFADDVLHGLPLRRLPGGELKAEHRDLAASAQRAIEDGLSAFIEANRLPSDRRLCLAGGVAENSVAVGKLVSANTFDDVFVAPSCGDAGTALGAALLVAGTEDSRPPRLERVGLGPAYSDERVARTLRRCGVPFVEVDDPAAAAAALLVEQKVVGWFQGRMEFGPRALGSRSLLADPTTEAMKERVNRVKRREQFRPFGPSVLAEHMGELFGSVPPASFMSFTLPTLDPGAIVAATHIDGTSRPHSVPADDSDYRRLIELFREKSGVPAVLNTSLNSGWEPIVTAPDQALAFLFSSSADALVIGRYVVSKGDR